MDQPDPPKRKIVVIGLGYVGLPLAVALAQKFAVTGIDADERRVAELLSGHDRTREVARETLEQSRLTLTSDTARGHGATMYVVAVPTPVDKDNRPDLSAVLSASRAVAAMIDPALRPTVVFESTVYPGVTEDICGQEIERCGNLRRGRDFRLGYSPERINPGDHEHSIDKITKVIAGEDSEVVDELAEVYGAITAGGVFRAASIRTAEAAKVIENAQRDINIAFINEVAQIFTLAGLSVWDVLAAARTKWNFLPFEPGLVGGHCIGVDPYYLSHLAEQLGQHPRVILAGRETNDRMGEWIVDRLHERRGGIPGSAIVLGATFKENVPDIRNSRSFDLVKRLDELGYAVAVADPVADPDELRGHEFDVVEPNGTAYDLVIGAVAHRVYRDLDGVTLGAMVKPGGILADLKGMWRDRVLAEGVELWSL